jgi:hypothetical protein
MATNMASGHRERLGCAAKHGKSDALRRLFHDVEDCSRVHQPEHKKGTTACMVMASQSDEGYQYL